MRKTCFGQSPRDSRFYGNDSATKNTANTKEGREKAKAKDAMKMRITTDH